ncbi:hypothetical protein SSS_01690 [Sarcoptes scabiei]|uniref:Uncharacterized protein n=1 Tax=Sarcoptes scabiei TaxID=52283 RepID=A0A834R5E2_SARSC|nr:hypothetical protein SSS_01690 [Sarcoptes scabiei]
MILLSSYLVSIDQKKKKNKKKLQNKKTMMEINEEIRMISFEIKHLRLPHKMKQYQRFRSRIVSIQNLIEKQKKENQNQSQSMQKCFERNRIEFDNQRSNENQNDTFEIDSNIGFDSNEKNQEKQDQFDCFDDVIENLFEQLNQKVICGVQQCFLCGSCSSDGTKSIRYGENDDDEKNEEIRLKKIHQEECLNSEQNSTKEIDLDRIGSESKLTTISNNDSSEDLEETILSSYDRNKMNHRTTASLLETEKDGESETESDFTSKKIILSLAIVEKISIISIIIIIIILSEKTKAIEFIKILSKITLKNDQKSIRFD